ncbi:MAG: hypothetical protein AAF533_29990 [Acidobacteriota bacterium]
MKHFAVAAVLTLLTATTASAQPFEAEADLLFRQSEIREGSIDLEGVTRIRIVSNGDELQVQGLTYTDALIYSGMAWAHDLSDIDDVQVEITRTGTLVTLEARRPPRHEAETRLVVNVELPDWLPVDIDDGAGTVTVRQLLRLNAVDGAGAITIEDIAEDLTLEDGSGPVSLKGVHGSVTLLDGPGDLDVADVGGNLNLRDGAGALRAHDVDGDVLVDDGSGGISLGRIRGDVDVRTGDTDGLDARHVGGKLTIRNDRGDLS